jgi:hypothetical protein
MSFVNIEPSIKTRKYNIMKLKMGAKKKLNLFEYHSMFDEDILISYKGPFDEHILSVVGNYLRLLLPQEEQSSKKIFAIFMELAQNISYYSSNVDKIGMQKSGVGTLVISEGDDYYHFMTGNIVRNVDVIPVLEKCEVINSLDREGLRKYKREQRNLPPGVHGGAHIGLIQVALTSANPLDIEVTPISNDASFFSICVRIDKHKQNSDN